MGLVMELLRKILYQEKSFIIDKLITYLKRELNIDYYKYKLIDIDDNIADILVKKDSQIFKDNIDGKEYLNFKTICSYSIFFVATLCSVFAYKYLPLSYGPVLGTLEYIFVATLSYIFLKEKIKKKKLIGLFIVLMGVFIYSI